MALLNSIHRQMNQSIDGVFFSIWWIKMSIHVVTFCMFPIVGPSEYAPAVKDNVNTTQAQQSRVRILNSKVISASLGKGRHIQLSQPIRLILKHLQTDNVTNAVCVFWNYIDQYDKSVIFLFLLLSFCFEHFLSFHSWSIIWNVPIWLIYHVLFFFSFSCVCLYF